ncbi:hypothetical protein Tco_0115115 [Tanacetum coccineum]
MHTVHGDEVASIKRRRRDVSSDDVQNFTTASGRGQLKEDLESSTWRQQIGIMEHELRTKRRNNFEEELFKDMFPTEEELAYHKELLGEPCPPFSTLEPKISRGNPWSLKIPYVIGTVYTGHAYIDLQSPVNIMSRAYYNKIREKSFQARRNPYQPYKFCNFVRRAKNVHIFNGCFIYVVDFMTWKNGGGTDFSSFFGNIIDSSLSEVVMGKPFAQASKLTYDESLGLIRFAYSDDEVVFRMPQRTKELDLVSPLEKDKFEAFFVESLKHLDGFGKDMQMAGDGVPGISDAVVVPYSNGIRNSRRHQDVARLKYGSRFIDLSRRKRE